MTTYKGILGQTVQSLASDPTASTITEGQLWYNSASNVWKLSSPGAGAWSSIAALNTALYQIQGVGIQSATLMIGGGPGYVTVNQSYNGSTWTELADMANGRQGPGAAGTSTAAIVYGCKPSTPLVEQFNGSTWTEVGDLNTARPYVASSIAGSVTATLAIGGGPASATNMTITEEYNGTAWTEVADTNAGKYKSSGAGTSTSALVVGEETAPGVETELYNGTSWTEVSNLNKYGVGMACGGSRTGNTAVWVMGGGYPQRHDGTNSFTELWNGTSWTEAADCPTPTEGTGGSGTTVAGVAAGGIVNNLNASTNSYEWNDPVFTNKTVTTS